MFVSHVKGPNKDSCLQNSPCPPTLFCARTFIIPHEVKLVVLDAVNNTVNLKNEGVKYGSYARVNARRNANNMLTNPFNPNCCKKNVNIPLKPKSPAIAFYQIIR